MSPTTRPLALEFQLSLSEHYHWSLDRWSRGFGHQIVGTNCLAHQISDLIIEWGEGKSLCVFIKIIYQNFKAK